MRTIICALVLSIIAMASSAPVVAQAGVCNRASDDTRARIQSDVQGWINAINSTDLPPPVKQAHITLFLYNQSQSLIAMEKVRVDCTNAFKPYQQVVDAMVTIYTGGLNKILAPHMTHVDVSEILSGYPLGGPNALVPRFREQVLRGDRGTIANIVRDPWKCLTFQRKC